MKKIGVIGDIHGNIDIFNHAAQHLKQHDVEHIILLGDLIDRGNQNIQCLDFARELKNHFSKTTYIIGNHESMMLATLCDTDLNNANESGGIWVQNGGNKVINELFGEKWPNKVSLISDQLKPYTDWMLSEWKTYYQSGNIFFTHAGVPPDKIDFENAKCDPLWLPIKVVNEELSLQWVRHSFLTSCSHHGLFVIHGHTINKSDSDVCSRIESHHSLCLDRGSYRGTGVRTCVLEPSSNKDLTILKIHFISP